jgi:ATP-binding cassette, subfamily B, bacterial
MEHGTLTEAGTHDELIARDGSYAQMWATFSGDAELVA